MEALKTELEQKAKCIAEKWLIVSKDKSNVRINNFSEGFLEAKQKTAGPAVLTSENTYKNNKLEACIKHTWAAEGEPDESQTITSPIPIKLKIKPRCKPESPAFANNVSVHQWH